MACIDSLYYLSPCRPVHTGKPEAAFCNIDISTPLLIPFLENEISLNIILVFNATEFILCIKLVLAAVF